jgi:hypothetical protein
MSDLQNNAHDLWIDGRKMTVKVQQIPNNSLRVTWTYPISDVIDGAVVLLSESRFSGDEYPEDGKRYTPSTNFAAPADKIGTAQVIAASYGYFNDDLTIVSVDVSNVDPNKVYYASIHAASNILQYFTIGVQSYAIETTVNERSVDTYAGSIPAQSIPPSNPSNGQAYYDHASNKVLVWNAATSTWLETSTDTVPVGTAPPVGPNHIFYDITYNKLVFFVGGMWVDCNASNTRVKFGSGYVPLGRFLRETPSDAQPGDISYNMGQDPLGAMPTPQMYVFTLGQWLPFTGNLFQFQTGPGEWTTAITGDTVCDYQPPAPPTIGDFFYQTVGRDLLVWDGDKWNKADTDSEGSATSDKIGIGTDGSYDERLRLIKTLKNQMGWPKICIELAEEQFNVAIDNALDEFRRRADNAYQHRHILFTVKNNQSTYYLNDPRLGTDKIVNILKIHRVSQSSMNAFGGSNIYSQPFIEQFYNGQNIDLVSIHLVSQMAEMFEKIFAGNIMYTWDEASRQLTLYRDIQTRSERVVLEVVIERTEQELINDRWAKQWIQGWAEAELKYTLGMIRSKYGSVAGPNGGLTLNGDMLISEANQDFAELLRQITDYEAGNGGVNFGNTAFFIG